MSGQNCALLTTDVSDYYLSNLKQKFSGSICFGASFSTYRVCVIRDETTIVMRITATRSEIRSNDLLMVQTILNFYCVPVAET